MKAPKYQRADMLHAVVGRAVMSTTDPIDRIEVVDGGFLVCAGDEQLVLHCVWDNDVSSDGLPMPGSGGWVATTEDDAGYDDLAARSRSGPSSHRQTPSIVRVAKRWFRRWL